MTLPTKISTRGKEDFLYNCFCIIYETKTIFDTQQHKGVRQWPVEVEKMYNDPQQFLPIKWQPKELKNAAFICKLSHSSK